MIKIIHFWTIVLFLVISPNLGDGEGWKPPHAVLKVSGLSVMMMMMVMKIVMTIVMMMMVDEGRKHT